MKTVGLRLRTLREERGLSLSEVARRAGTSTAAVRLVEVGQRAATVVTLDVICRALGVSVAAVFETAALAKNPPLSTEHRILLRLMRSLRGRPLWQVRAVERLVAELDRANDSWRPKKK